MTSTRYEYLEINQRTLSSSYKSCIWIIYIFCESHNNELSLEIPKYILLKFYELREKVVK